MKKSVMFGSKVNIERGFDKTQNVIDVKQLLASLGKPNACLSHDDGELLLYPPKDNSDVPFAVIVGMTTEKAEYFMRQLANWPHVLEDLMIQRVDTEKCLGLAPAFHLEIDKKSFSRILDEK